MKRTLINPELNTIPEQFHGLLSEAQIFDSSCSKEAQVYFIDKDGGYYLKSSAKGSLKTEAKMTAYFHKKELAAEVLGYHSGEQDWLLTRRIPGEDCTLPMFRDDPKRLCDITATLLRHLHSLDFSDCPVQNRNETYLATARQNYHAKAFDRSLFPDNWGYDTPEEAWKVIEENAHLLKSDVLLHGDYCLPNIMLDNWKFSGFIDVGNGGVGDRHIDLFWGTWTLFFNLKTNDYFDRFLDVYGREAVEPEMLRVIAAFECFG